MQPNACGDDIRLWSKRQETKRKFFGNFQKIQLILINVQGIAGLDKKTDSQKDLMDYEHQETTNGAHKFNGVWYCEDHRVLMDREGKHLEIRPKSLALFRYLMQHPNQVVSRNVLVEAIWGSVVTTHDTLNKSIADIRRVIGDNRRRVLKTIPKRGFVLIPDRAPEVSPIITSDASSGEFTNYDKSRLQPVKKVSVVWQIALISLLGILLITGLFAYRTTQHELNYTKNGLPTLTVASVGEVSDDFLGEIKIALSRYRTITLLEKSDTDFIATVRMSRESTGGLEKEKVVVELLDSRNDEVLFANGWIVSNQKGNLISEVAASMAASLVSPGGGVIGNRLLATSRDKPVEELTRAECYAHGYGCRTCSGEEESITPRAQACLKRLLIEDPADSKAWALKSIVLTRMNWFGLLQTQEQLADPQFQQSLLDGAREAANKAEALSDGMDSAVYWSMAQAYVNSCQPEKLKFAIDEGLRINPNDPSMLGSFGSWLAYSGMWDEGAAMVEKAVSLNPPKIKKWWLYAPAKRHFHYGDYQGMLDGIMRSYNERNWLSHLQLAYTLPYLDRTKEARAEAKKVRELYPGMTRKIALAFYRKFCFQPSFLEAMDEGLRRAGLP